MILAVLGAIIGAKVGQRAGRNLGAAMEQEIARQVWAEQQRQRAWAEYYAQQHRERENVGDAGQA